jgi:hypothetical protein
MVHHGQATNGDDLPVRGKVPSVCARPFCKKFRQVKSERFPLQTGRSGPSHVETNQATLN